MAALLLSAGCTLDRTNDYDPEVELSFHPEMYLAAKSDINEEYPDTQPFAVCAWTLSRNSAWSENSSEAVMYLDNETAHPGDNGYRLSEPTLWPSKKERLNVIAYTPVEAFTSCTKENGAECTYDILESQTDLLYTDPQADLDKMECGGLVQLPFRHALCKVAFEVKNRVAKNEEIIVKSIRIDGVKHRGGFASLPQPTWTTEDDTTPLLFFEGEQETENTPAEIGRSWYIIPQDLSTKVTVEYEYRTAADTGFTLTLKTCDLQTKLEPGRQYTYTLSVGIDDVKFLLEIIEDRFK